MLAWLWRRVVQRRLGRRDPGGLDCPFERFAGDLAHEPGFVAAGEDERARGEQLAALGDEREQPVHQLRRDVDHPPRFLSLEQGAGAVAAKLALDTDHRVLAV
jgi:hypothetical protein